MWFPAELAVATEVRVLDVGPRVERTWRLTTAIGIGGVRFARALPFEAGRPVRVELTLPDDERALVVTGVVALDVERARQGREGAEPLPAVVEFFALDSDARGRLERYLEERTAA